MTYPASCSTWSSRVSTETPRHSVSSFDHRVTQWMSTVTVSAGSSWNSCQLQDFSVAPPWRTEKVHSASGVCGVGPADSTGNPSVTYCPGGTRSASPAGTVRCRLKPGDIGLIPGLAPSRLGPSKQIVVSGQRGWQIPFYSWPAVGTNNDCAIVICGTQ